MTRPKVSKRERKRTMIPLGLISMLQLLVFWSKRSRLWISILAVAISNFGEPMPPRAMRSFIEKGFPTAPSTLRATFLSVYERFSSMFKSIVQGAVGPLQRTHVALLVPADQNRIYP